MRHSLRWRYAWRHLWQHKGRSALVVLSIAVGVFAFALISGAVTTLRKDLYANYQLIFPASARLHTTPFDETMVEAIRRMPDVATAEGRRRELVRFQDASGEWKDMQLIALDDYADSRVDVVRPNSGAWPPPDKRALVERNSLFLTGAEVGDSLRIETGDGRERELPIAGLAHDMNEAPAQITGVPYAYVTRDTLEWLGLSPDFNEMLILVAGDRFDKDYVDVVARAAAKKMEDSGNTVLWMEVPRPGSHYVEQFLPTIIMILSTLGILALLLSAFLVINVISAMLTQQTRQIGIMKSIGARPRQIAGMYFRLVLLFGAAALALAVPLGALAASAFARFIAGQLNFDINRFEVPLPTLLLELAVGLLVPVLAALFPIVAAVRMSVREALADQGLGTENARGTRLDAFLQTNLARLNLARPLHLSLRNTFRRKGRLVRTLIPLMLGGAIFMAVISLRASLFRTLEATLVNQGFDVQVRLAAPQRVSRLVSEALAVPGVAAAEAWSVYEGIPIHTDATEGKSTYVYGLPAASQLFTPNIVDGRWLTPEDTNAVVVPTSLLYDEPTATVGNTLTLRIGSKELDFEVVGIHKTFQPPVAPAIVYVNQPYLWRELGNQGRADTLRVITDPQDAATDVAVMEAVAARMEAAKFEVKSTRNATEDRRIFTERFNIITVILMIMSTLLATVGGLGLMGTMSLNILERTREIGVLRAIGASTRALLQIFVVEGVAIGQMSWVGGLILSVPLSLVMSRQVGMAFTRAPLDWVYDLRGPLIWLGIVLAVSALASLVPAYSAANLTVRDTLSYE